MRGSSRLDGVPEYLSTRLMRTVAEARARGVDVISLGIGDPDTPPPLDLREEIGAQALHDGLHVYPTNHGIAAAARGRRRALPRRASASSSTPSARSCRCSAPRRASRTSASRSSTRATSRSSPIRATPSTTAARRSPAARRCGLPLRAEHGFLPDLDAHRRGREPPRQPADLRVPEQPDRRGRRRSASSSGWRRGGRERGVAICHDNAYAELTYDGIVAPSFLAAPGAREAGIEIYSLSKSLSMPGLAHRLRRRQRRADRAPAHAQDEHRLGHVAGRAARGRPRGRARALVHGRACASSTAAAATCSATVSSALGLEHVRPQGALYVWVRVPGGGGSVAFAERLLEHAAVVVGPGAAYGPSSDGYVRLSLTVSGGAPRRGARAHLRALTAL